jgi:cytochrome b pre-mRNA-processing protein 3
MSHTPPDPSITARGWRRLWHRLRAAERARDGRRQVADQLYHAVVKQARKPVWYRELAVPDTPEGRFETIALHTALLLRRLRREGTTGQALGQELFDAMFVDLDGNLRELGVSDLSVGAYVKRLAGNFYARLAALDKSLEGIGSSDATGESRQEPSLTRMLRANTYHDAAPTDRQLAALARWVIEQDHELAEQEGTALLAGIVVWVEPVAPT